MGRGPTKRRFALLCALLAFGAINAAAGWAADRTDRSFGDGFVETPLSTEADAADAAPAIWDLAPTPGGDIIAGVSDLSAAANFFGLARYGRNGRFDRGFGREGFTRRLPLKKAQGQGVAVQADGRIVQVGYQRVHSLGGGTPVVARFRAGGHLDPSFGSRGLFAPGPVGSYRHSEVLHDVVVQPGGRIVAVGATGEHGIGESSKKPAGLVLALRPDGRVDRSFGDQGRIVFPAPGDNREYTGLKSVELLPDGKLLVAGFHFGSVSSPGSTRTVASIAPSALAPGRSRGSTANAATGAGASAGRQPRWRSSPTDGSSPSSPAFPMCRS